MEKSRDMLFSMRYFTVKGFYDIIILTLLSGVQQWQMQLLQVREKE